MLVTFKSKAYANVLMSGNTGPKMLEMMGFGVAIPGAIDAQDVESALNNLKTALAKIPDSIDTNNNSGGDEPRIGLHTRAVTLLEMLQSALREETYVRWE